VLASEFLHLFLEAERHSAMRAYTDPNSHLGSGESGKSTIVKQMKIIHQNGYTNDELLAFRPLIWKNLIESARDVVHALVKFNLEPINPANKVRCHQSFFVVLHSYRCSGKHRTHHELPAGHRQSTVLLQSRHRPRRAGSVGR
jgi:hypothetical protein